MYFEVDGSTPMIRMSRYVSFFQERERDGGRFRLAADRALGRHDKKKRARPVRLARNKLHTS
jgi:hypothetical protein